MKSWRKSKQFICIICEKDFDKERQLKQHKKDSHRNMDLKKLQMTKSSIVSEESYKN